MNRMWISNTALAVVLVAGTAAATNAFAHGAAHMQGQAGYGPGTHAPCYAQQGMGQGMGSGMMGQGMGPGMMGQGMGPGMMGQGMGPGAYLEQDLTADQVKTILEHRLQHYGNDRLRVGKVEAQDDDSIIAEIETVDGSLVEQFLVDRHTGQMQRPQ